MKSKRQFQISMKLLLILVVLLVAASTIISMLMLSASMHAISQYRDDMYRGLLESYGKILENNCSALNTMMNVTSLDQGIRENIFKSEVTDSQMLTMGEKMRKVIKSNTYLLCGNIDIYQHKFFTNLPSDGINFFPMSRMPSEPWYQEFMDQGEVSWHCLNVNTITAKWQYVLVHSINDFGVDRSGRAGGGTPAVCYESVQVNVSDLLPEKRKFVSNLPMEVFLFAPSGENIYASQTKLEEEAVSSLKSWREGGTVGICRIDGVDYHPMCLKLPELGADLVMFFPPLENSERILRSEAPVLMLLALIITLLGAMLFFFYWGYRRRLRHLILRLDDFSETSPAEDLPGSRRDELDEIDFHIIQMQNRIRSLIEEEYKTKLHAVSAQNEALMTCINPHFLYNTLNSISSVALLEGASDTNNMIYALSDMFRYSSDLTHPEVPLENELKNIENYFYIQGIRFKDSFAWSIDVPLEFRDCLVPKLILQPVVENCFKHGFEARGKKGRINTIKISASREEEKLILTVTDNGRGMTIERQRAIEERLAEGEKEEKTPSAEIGLCNVHRRLRLLYGSEYGITIFCKEGVYTSVKITVKFEKAESLGGDRDVQDLDR